MEVIYVTLDPQNERLMIDAVNVLNGISFNCECGMYKRGYRNDMIVNMTVAATMLGLDPYWVLGKFMNANLIQDEMDDEHPEDRMRTVMDYSDRFSWGWMISPDDWEINGIINQDLIKVLKFECRSAETTDEAEEEASTR